jgi:hypothetical protein
MTTSAYTVGPGKPPLHSSIQKGKSGNPGGRPGAAKQLKQRFHRALREALEKTSQALEAARPADMLAARARQFTPDAVAGRSPAQRLLLSLQERDAGEKEDRVTRLIESEHGVAPSFEECPKGGSSEGGRTAPFSLSEGESQGENQQRVVEILKILNEKASAPKEQGKAREIADGAPAGEALEPARSRRQRAMRGQGCVETCAGGDGSAFHGRRLGRGYDPRAGSRRTRSPAPAANPDLRGDCVFRGRIPRVKCGADYQIRLSGPLLDRIGACAVIRFCQPTCVCRYFKQLTIKLLVGLQPARRRSINALRRRRCRWS